VLISEAVRGEGAYLINSQGDRFMAQYAPVEWSWPRDITSRATAREIRAGRGIHPMAVQGGLCLSGSASHGSGKIMSRIPFAGGSSSAAGH